MGKVKTLIGYRKLQFVLYSYYTGLASVGHCANECFFGSLMNLGEPVAPIAKGGDRHRVVGGLSREQASVRQCHQELIQRQHA